MMRRMREWRGWMVAGLAACFVASCAQDEAEREYYDALRGEETGMGRQAQIAHLDRAIALQPRRAWYRETHAIYEIDVRDYAQAASDLDTAIALADRPYLRFLRGLVACERGRYDASLPDFDLAITKQPANTQFYRGRSLARSKVGRYAEALEDARHLVATVPQQGESHYALGVALSGMGRWGEAVAAFDEALRRRPDLIYPLSARADARDRLGDAAGAAADRETAAGKTRDRAYAIAVDPFRY